MLLEFIPIRMCKVASYKRFSIWSHWTNITSAIQNDWYISSIHQLYLEDNNKKCNWLAIRNLISIKSSKIKETIFSPIFITCNTIIVTNIYRLLKVVKKERERSALEQVNVRHTGLLLPSLLWHIQSLMESYEGLELKWKPFWHRRQWLAADVAVTTASCCAEMYYWNTISMSR